MKYRLWIEKKHVSLLFTSIVYFVLSLFHHQLIMFTPTDSSETSSPTKKVKTAEEKPPSA